MYNWIEGISDLQVSESNVSWLGYIIEMIYISEMCNEVEYDG